MLFAKTEQELVDMVQLLVEAFADVGLDLNVAKSKILTNVPTSYSYLDIDENFVEIIEAGSHHKYLGRYLAGESTFREQTEVNHRIQCAWYKFGQMKNILCNHHISIQLRLKLFDAVVTPTILFGLAVLPLSSASLEKIQVTQRKMLRKMVKWVRIQGEAWDVTMRRMKMRVASASEKYPVMPWKNRIAKYLWQFILRIKMAPNESWIKQVSNWEPNECDDPFNKYFPHRCRGRPSLRWDDTVRSFCRLHFNESWQNCSIDVLRPCIDDFVAYFCE